jgi:indole-3-glycerol phosphate synthase / phosphoribosylanthranilate isomerase
MVLERILKAKREHVAARKAKRPLSTFREQVVPSERSLTERLRRPGAQYVLECKKASPSKGLIRKDYDPAVIARVYEPFAAGISVLADEPFFQGALADIASVRQAVNIPILCKDFVVDSYQIYEARHLGADAVLLMLSVLDPEECKRCLQICETLQMDALVEVHSAEELASAVELEAKLVGINNRNLKTLEVSLNVAFDLAPSLPASTTVISESGIITRADIRQLQPVVDGFLIGTSLMKSPHIARALRELVFGRVKVCGLTRVEDALAAWQGGATWGGMIFAESPRCIDIDTALKLRQVSELQWAGVFVNEDPKRVADCAQKLKLNAIQLHGDEDSEYVAKLRERVGDKMMIWKSTNGRGTAALPNAAGFGADRLLIDNGSAKARGGTGETFDWRVFAEHNQRSEMLLAGGLGPENAWLADQLGPWALDLNSGVESAPGIKDVQRLSAVFEALRGNGSQTL